MPCNSIRLNSIELKAKNQVHLIAGLKAAGFQVSESRSRGLDVLTVTGKGGWATISNGKITVGEGNEFLADEIHLAYSKQIVKVAASKYGWAIQKKGERKLQLQRR